MYTYVVGTAVSVVSLYTYIRMLLGAVHHLRIQFDVRANYYIVSIYVHGDHRHGAFHHRMV